MSKARQQLARVQGILARSRDTLDYKIESARVDFTEEALEIMARRGIGKADLARKLGVSKPYVTKLIGGGANLTLESMVRLAEALDCRLSTHLTESGFSPQWLDVSENTDSCRFPSQPALKNSTRSPSPMTPSPLQLESSFLLHTEVKVAEKIPAEVGQTIKTRTRIGRSPENELEWNVILGVTFGRNGKIVDAPYHGDVLVEMRFLLHPDYPADKRNTLMQITGASLAYGMIRETVANLTARGPHGTYLLPSVSFLETKRKLAKK